MTTRVGLLMTVTAMLAMAMGTGAAGAARPLANPVPALLKQVQKERKALGKADTAQLKARLRVTTRAVRSRKPCNAIKALGAFVDRTKRVRGAEAAPAAARLGKRARAAQGRLLLRARGKQACGKVTLRMSAAVKPSVRKLEPLADGRARPVTAMQGKRAKTDFVENELVIAVRSPAQLAGFLRRTKGKVVGTATMKGAVTKYATTHLVRIPAQKGSTATIRRRLTADLRRIDPRARGGLRFEDGAGMRTLSVAAREAARGLHVGVNQVFRSAMSVDPDDLVVFPGQQFLDGRTVDGERKNRPPADAFTDLSLRNGGVLDYGVTAAWQDLEVAGKLVPNSVDVAVIDSGFMKTDELPGSIYPTQAGPEAGKERHGFAVTQAVAGRPDNGLGLAGVGGPVARVRGIFYNLDGFSAMARMYDAIETGARVINMSSGAELDALASFASVPLDDATQEAWARNRLVLASAGNSGRDVNAEDCLFVCWEEELVAPCENNGVLCIGGLSDDGSDALKDPGSNYGFESCGSYDCSVKLFAPYTMRLLTDAQAVDSRTGTSFSSPFVAGAAALMLAADPGLSASTLRATLLRTAHTYDRAKELVNPVAGHKLPRWIDVEAAVDSVLEPTPPVVGIVPVAGGTYSLNIQRRLRGVALVQDGLQGQAGCCTYTWRSDLDGPLGVGREIDAVFGAGAGTRTITLRAQTASGMATEASTLVTFGGNPPVPVITKPAANAVLSRGIKYKFQGSWTDQDQGFAAGDCAALRWTVDRGSGAPTVLTGCQPEITFGVNGPKTVTLEATDGDGFKATAVRSLTVTDPPLNAPPIVQILSPDDGQALQPGTTYQLDAEATDPDGTGPITYQWTVQRASGSGAETEISTARQFTWRPGDDISASCGGTTITLRFKATDPNGTSVDSTTHQVPYPVCRPR